MATTLRNRAYHAICSKIISGQLPPGSRLSDFSIAKELGISRSPVREAISQLVCEGLAVSIPEVGAFTRKFARADIEHLFQFRCWLEVKAVEEAMQRITADELQQLGGYCDQILIEARECRASGEQYLGMPGYWRWLKADFSFHFTIVRAAGNPLMLKTVASQYFVSNCLNGYLWQHTVGDLVYLYRQHRGILRALRHRNVIAARQMIEEHAERGKLHAIKLLEQQEARPDLPGSEASWLNSLHELVEGIVENKPRV